MEIAMNRCRLVVAVCLFFLVACGGGNPSASLSTAMLGFGTEATGSTSQPLTITVTNSGSASLHISGVAPSAQFAEDDSCKSALRPGASCLITVTFVPTDAGPITGSLSITDDAKDSPQTVSLTG